MAKGATLIDVGTGFASNSTLDANFDALNAAFENTLSLDGSTPNAMNADLDMNSNSIINASSVYINGVAVSTGLTVASTDDPVFASRGEAISATIDSGVSSFFTRGYTSEGDGGGALYVRNGSEPSHAGKFQSADGAWWELKPGGIVNARTFGFLPSETAANNQTALSNWAAYISQANGGFGVIPAGTYSINGGIGFTKGRFCISAYGAIITQEATSGVTVDLNSGALADESVITGNVQWYGGKFIHNVPFATTPNTCTAIRARGITGCLIKDVEVEDYDVGIAQSVRDQLIVSNFYGFQNDINILGENWVTTAGGNPQCVFIEGIRVSSFYSYGVRFEGVTNNLTIRNGYILPHSTATGAAIDLENGVTGVDSRQGLIEAIDFEQPVSSSYFFINISDTNSRTFRELTVRNCGVSASSKFINLVDCSGVCIENNHVVTQETGWITIDSTSTDIDIGRNEYVGLAWNAWPAITYSCARDEITVWPYKVVFENDEGLLTGFSGSAFSDATDTQMDLSTLLGSNFPSICVPRGYWVKGELRDSASSTGPSSAYFLPASGLATNDYWQHVGADFAGWGNNQWFPISGYVTCDSNGDLFYTVDASGVGTLDIRFKIVGIDMGGGK